MNQEIEETELDDGTEKVDLYENGKITDSGDDSIV